jgi:hypothetical protein
MSGSKNCAKYEEKLSAYLDGRLSADQMAEVATHLESCPVCSALLEKMAGLDKLAAESLNDFDDAVLSDLERKIADKIEALPAPGVVNGAHKSRIFPLWQKYVAVAASIAVLFLVGRMAFKENVPPLNSPTLEAPAVRSTSPIDAQPAPELKNTATPIQQLTPPPSPSRGVTQDKRAVRQAKEAGKDENVQMMGSSKPGTREAADDKLQNAPADEGKLKKTVQKDQAAEAVPPASPSIQKNATSYKATDQSGTSANESSGGGVSTTSLTDEGKQPPNIQLKDKLAQTNIGKRSGIDFNVTHPTSVKNSGIDVNLVKSDGSLQSSYVEAVNSYINKKVSEKESHRLAAMSPVSPTQDTLSAVNAFLQTLQHEPAQPSLQDSLKSLYLQSCAHYDIYRLSGQQEHYAAAVKMKDSLQQLTVERIDTTAASAYLKAYLQEIEALQLTQ